MIDARTSLEDLETATRKLLAYCWANDWAGHDPYDALNSRVFTAMPVLDSRLPRLVITQILKRSPINVRGLMLIRSEEHTSELQSRLHLVCRLLLEKKKKPIDGPVHGEALQHRQR